MSEDKRSRLINPSPDDSPEVRLLREGIMQVRGRIKWTEGELVDLRLREETLWATLRKVEAAETKEGGE